MDQGSPTARPGRTLRPPLTALLVAAAFLAALALSACTSRDPKAGRAPLSPQKELVQEALDTLEKVRAEVQDQALDFLLSRAAGVMIAPQVHKAAFVGSLRLGSAVMLARDRAGFWSPPVFYRISQAGVGLQAGVQTGGFIVVFMDREGFREAADGGGALGGDGRVSFWDSSWGHAADSWTRSHQAVCFDATGGLFAGASFEAGGVTPYDLRNQGWYGTDALPEDVLFGDWAEHPDKGAVLRHSLAESAIRFPGTTAWD